LSELSWRVLEDPVRRRRDIAGPRAFAFGAAMLLVVAGAGAVVRARPPALSVGPEATAPTLEVTTTSAPTVVVTDPSAPTTVATAPTLPGAGATIQPVADALYGMNVPPNLTPSLSGALGDQPVIYENGCHANFSETVPKDCGCGDAT
ncbi:MAG: hypothetical protein ACKOQ7_06105, partial [Actinomycetota bacterium]